MFFAAASELTIQRSTILGVFLAIVFAIVAGYISAGICMLFAMGGTHDWVENWMPLLILAGAVGGGWLGWEFVAWCT